MLPMNKRSLLYGFCFLIITLAHAQQDKTSAVRYAIWDHAYKTGMTGCSVAIAEKGQILFAYGSGFADLENMVLAKPQSVYRLASVSKSITAVAVMQLVEQGKVNLDTDLRQYVPEFPQKEHVFTVRQVLAHLSGIRHYKPSEPENREEYANTLEALKRFQDDPILHKPGEKYTYSTYAYTLLARLVENVSGMTFPDYLRRHVFEPIGMLTTGIEDQINLVPNRARGYVRGKDGKPVNSEYANISYKWAGGGMVSTAPDLCRLGMALLENRLMKPETRAMMWAMQTTNDGKKTGYGLGWGIGAWTGHPMMSHSGAQSMVRTRLCIFPEEQIVIVVLTNYESHDVGALTNRIIQAWMSTDKQ
jgi:serine beta-lactamase-like protein LACTB